MGKLQTHDERFDSSHEEKHKGRDDIANADSLVIDAAQDAANARTCFPNRLELEVDNRFTRAHDARRLTEFRAVQ